MIALAFLACTLMTLIYSFFYVISLLFFGRDSAFVGALPIPLAGGCSWPSWPPCWPEKRD